MDVLWLKSQGLPHGEICRLTGISGLLAQKSVVECNRLISFATYVPVST